MKSVILLTHKLHRGLVGCYRQTRCRTLIISQSQNLLQVTIVHSNIMYFNYRLIISTTSLPQLWMIDLLWTSESFVTAHHKLNNVAFSEVACCVESGLPSQRTGRTSSTKGRTRGRTLLFNHRWRRSTKLTGRSRISQRLQGNGKPFGSNCFLY